MTDKEKQILLAEIERQIEHSKHCYEFTHSNSARKFQDGEISGFKTIQKFINSLPEEPVSKDLEEAAKENAKIERSDDTEVGYYINRFGGFVDGAMWDRQRTINKACEWLDKYASDFVALADDSHPAIGDTQAFYSTKSLLHYFRQEMED